MKKYAAPGSVLALLLFVGSPHAQTKRSITETDLFKFTWIADPQLSPDGARVAFVRVIVNEKENRYETSLFVVPSSGSEAPSRLTAGIHDTAPRWSPEGTRLAFVRASEKDGKTQPPQIYVLQMDGGEARPITDAAGGAGSPAWSPDGATIAFTSDEPRKAVDEKPTTEHKTDIRVVTSAVYRSNGNPTYVEPDRHSHIFTVRVPPPSSSAASSAPAAKQITDGEFDEHGVAWAPDGSKIYFTSTRVAEPYYDESGAELFAVPAAGGAVEKIAGIDGTIADFTLSPDGRRIAFVGELRGRPIRSYSQPDLFVVDAAPSSAPKNLTERYDYDIGGGIGGDQAAPRGANRKPILWSADGRSLLVVAAENGRSNLKRVTIASGAVEDVTTGAHDIVAYSATPDGAAIAATISTQTSIGDIFMVGDPERIALPNTAGATTAGRLFQGRQITHVNDDLFKDIQQSEPEEMWYRTFDGKNVQGWILKPPDFDASRKYPLILEIHGGPHAAYGSTYTHEFQWMAAKGYVVLFTNPRGSTSYGQEFGNIIQFHYPGDDYKDLMAGVDEVLKKGYVDANRLGVTGGSGGGLLTNWTITQTQRFKAAVAQRDIADWYGFWFTADFTLFQPTWFRKAPWEDPQDFAARSPITHVANVTTPLMLVLGDQDYRTPPADGGEMMFRALKYRKIPTVMVRFPRENHELSRSGEPWHRVERLQQIVGWMDEWLMGKKPKS